MIPYIIISVFTLYVVHEVRVKMFRKSLKEGCRASFYVGIKKHSGKVKSILRSEHIDTIVKEDGTIVNKRASRITFVQIDDCLVFINDVYP